MKKFVLIVYNTAIESKIMDTLENLGIKSWTRINRIQGIGTHSVPHLDSHIWPGINNVFLIGIEEEKGEELLEGIRKLKSIYLKEGIKAFVLPLEEVI